MDTRTFYLFARPSFFEGMGRIFDVGGTLNIYNESATESEADFRALKSDWVMVGEDLKKAISLYELTAPVGAKLTAR